MILPDLILPSRVNLYCTESGIDSLLHCHDKKHFKNYPYEVAYQYNSRGFRDQEWPAGYAALKSAIWCVGDSFTVGLGSPVEHTWPYAVADRLDAKTINVAMDGASNNWIARRAVDIVNAVGPVKMIIMWSYFHRREINNTFANDERRRVNFILESLEHETADYENFINCVNAVNRVLPDCIHFIIPSAAANISPDRTYETIQAKWNLIKGPDWPESAPASIDAYLQLPKFVKDEIVNIHHFDSYLKQLLNSIQAALPLHNHLKSTVKYYAGEVPMLDRARDGHHFDQLTSLWVADAVERLCPEWIR